jgi:hypothetical protein
VPTFDPAERRALQQGVASNLGGFAACHAAARDRDPGLAGTVTLRWQIGESGVPEAIEVAGAGDAALFTCLGDAAAALWIPGLPPRRFAVVHHFALAAPAPIVGDGHDAALDLLAARDADGALARWAALLAADPDGPDACRWRVGVLRASMARAPWLDDARVIAALTDLIAHARAIDAGAARACLATARPSIDLLVGPAERLETVDGFAASWQERLALLAVIVPASALLAEEDGERDLWPLAHALGVSLADPRAAIELLRPIADGDGWGRSTASDELARLTAEVARLGE